MTLGMIRTLLVLGMGFFWLLLVAGAASAQVTENVVSSDAANTTGIIFEGSKGSDLSKAVGDVSVVGTNSTAPCMVAVGGGLGMQGISIGMTTAIEDKGCTARQEATLLAQLSEVSQDIPPSAAAAAACIDDSMREAILMAGGTCPDRRDEGETDVSLVVSTEIEFTGGHYVFKTFADVRGQ